MELSDALSIEGSLKTPVRRAAEELRRRLGHPALNPLVRSARASTPDAFVFYAKHPRPHVGSKAQKQMLLPTRVTFDAAYTVWLHFKLYLRFSGVLGVLEFW